MASVRRPVLLDSSIYVTALRSGEVAVSLKRYLPAGSLLWLSAVVLEELYAGATDRSRWLVEALEREFARVNRILVPNLSDWTWTGRVLNRIGAKYGYEEIGRGRLANDALISMSAARRGIVVLTANEGDFGRIAEFRPFRWEVAKLVAGA